MAPAQAPSEPASARSVVMLFSKSLAGTACGNGFAIGDGSLIVTANHLVFPANSAGDHLGDSFVTVLSPYLGDACDAEIIVQDRVLDLVILRTPWRGHPALRLAEDADVVATEEITLMSYASVVSAVRSSREAGVTSSISIDIQPLVVDTVAVRKSVSRTMQARAHAALTPAWTGAPMILSGAGEVAACLAMLDAPPGGRAAGPTSAQMRRLAETAKLAEALQPAGQALPRPADAAPSTVLFAKAVAASAAQQPQQAFDLLQQFLKIRPQSAVAWRDAAGQAHALGRLDESQTMYAKALELQPSLTSARILYAQLLHERIMPGHALAQLRYIWQHGPHSTAAVVPMVNILRQQGKEQEALEILTRAVETSPNDSYLWLYLGQSRRALNDPNGAAAAYLRAAELLPENLSLRIQAAESFEAAQALDKAEEQYRTVVRIAPNSSAAHFFLARFLSTDTARKEQALAAAQKALELADQPGAPPRDRIHALISAINTGTPAGTELKL